MPYYLINVKLITDKNLVQREMLRTLRQIVDELRPVDMGKG
jgi:hypothetical protein